MQRVRVVADNLASASAQLDKLVEENRQDVRAFTREGLPELERFLREGRAAAREFRELSRSLREDPVAASLSAAAAGRGDSAMSRFALALSMVSHAACSRAARAAAQRCAADADLHPARGRRAPASAARGSARPRCGATSARFGAAPSVQLPRPSADPGLATELITLVRSDHRMDYYAGSRWAADAAGCRRDAGDRHAARAAARGAPCTSHRARFCATTCCRSTSGASRRTTPSGGVAPDACTWCWIARWRAGVGRELVAHVRRRRRSAGAARTG